ncbi:class I SAM-dependent methyltransferase [Streptomyces lancefieldiae]|uniref:Class I SAM-dependent methyltransferase n=1 Tax=Streptomyces lancefieldiae TaxID=3075520 RepID=A0ABU3AZH6_9ACTN|nr:class I SAM-dependent methyltransferase [Streptomyces sp. DSM 40712]MDT0615333.1 class I SAM-dependent methyltransferase [Streptomyces sp. DSM 40712]
MPAPSAPSAPPPVPPVPPMPLYGPHREDCPWCGSRRLRARSRRAVPGRSVLARCRDCRHVFRNPSLTSATEHPSGLAGAGLRHRLAARAILARCPEPESWLDVGTGDADFPRIARAYFPYTSFDGLDPTHRVLRARAVERVEEAFVGRLTDPHIAARLRARYDVVSLFQQLERVPDPRAELRAALHVLRPGGHLLVDVADPRRLFVLPPGTSHPAGLRAELAARGCTVLTGGRAPRVIARKEASAP